MEYQHYRTDQESREIIENNPGLAEVLGEFAILETELGRRPTLNELTEHMERKLGDE